MGFTNANFNTFTFNLHLICQLYPLTPVSELVFITKKRNAFILPYFATFLFQHLINFTTLGSKSGSRTKQSSDPSKAPAVHLARRHQAQEIFSKVMKKHCVHFVTL